jgi:predicted NBD/HSP70 family sugar kinase
MIRMSDRINRKVKADRSPVTATPKTVRHLNRAIVLDLIRQNQPLSRAELARLSGIHRSNISSIVDDLSRKGLLREERAQQFGRGRTPDLISLDRAAFRVMAISLLRARTTVAIGTLGGNIENSFTFVTPETPQQLVAAVEGAYRTLIQNISLMDAKTAPIKQVVISSPGILNRDRNGRTTITASEMPRYSDVDLAELVSKRLNLPVMIANNAGLAAMGLITSGDNAKRPMNDFVLLVVGESGVGSGLVIQRSLYSGFDAAYAGEVGHTVVDLKGPPCSCGRAGCLQLYVCDEATWKRYKPDQPFSPVNYEEFLDAVLAGSAKARAALRSTIEYLSVGISNIALMVNPERIVVAGSLMRIWPVLQKELEAAFFPRHHHTRIEPTKVPVDVLYLKGAVERALQEVLAKSNRSGA